MITANATPPAVPFEVVERRVIDIVCEQCGVEGLGIAGPEARFHQDIAFDSLDMIEMVMAFEEAFQVRMSDKWCEQLFASRQPVTLRMLARAIHEQMGTAPRPASPAAPLAAGLPNRVPFLQLGGRASVSEWLDGPLYEPRGVNQKGITEYRRRTDGMRCVALPAADVIPSGGPRPHKVPVAPFLADAEPVSNRAFARFLNSIGTVPPAVLRDWCSADGDHRRGVHFGLQRRWRRWVPHWPADRQPVILVSWYGAAAYALWAHRYDWRYYRGDGTVPVELEATRVTAPPPPAGWVALPSELQWEYAARGPEPRRYPWGDADPAPELLRVAQHQPGQDYTDLSLPAADVCDQLGMSPFGLHHMAGNVWQWCRDWYRPGDTPATAAEPTGIRSERGGSWVGPARLAECGYRRGRPPHARGRCLGFRCAGASIS
jgi:acyl carrier protein